MQIVFVALAEESQTQKLGGVADVNAWADDALKQCAIYELHFVSTTNVEMPIVETVRDGKVAIKFEPSGGDSIMGAIKGRTKLGDLLKGETKGGNNPFFVSVKCALPGNFRTHVQSGSEQRPNQVTRTCPGYEI